MPDEHCYNKGFMDPCAYCQSKQQFATGQSKFCPVISFIHAQAEE